MTNIDKSQLALAAVALASAGALTTALISQHVFGLWPCDLCHAQRVPYALSFVLAALCLMPALSPRERRIVLMHCAGLFIIGAEIAGYHIGVEEKWWAGPVSCSGGRQALSLDGLAGALTQAARPSCDEAAFRFLGISMAGYNFAASLILTGLCFWTAKQRAWWTKS